MPRAKPEKPFENARERIEHEDRARVLAVLKEFGGRTHEPMLTPEDDPANDPVKLALADEVLFLRDQMAHLVRAVGFIQGKPITVIGPGPYWTPRGVATEPPDAA
jgi:hypothetical protein